VTQIALSFPNIPICGLSALSRIRASSNAIVSAENLDSEIRERSEFTFQGFVLPQTPRLETKARRPRALNAEAATRAAVRLSVDVVPEHH